MKKFTALVLALLLSAFALSENYTSANGMRWGMTSAQVRALEGENCDEGSVSDRVTAVFCREYRISKFTAQYKLDLLADDRLFMVAYEINEAPLEDSFAYLRGAETSLYGVPSAVSGADITELMNGLQPLTTTFSDGCSWRTGDTVIYLTMDDNYVYLFYMDAAFDMGGMCAYDTTGL